MCVYVYAYIYMITKLLLMRYIREREEIQKGTQEF